MGRATFFYIHHIGTEYHLCNMHLIFWQKKNLYEKIKTKIGIYEAGRGSREGFF